MMVKRSISIVALSLILLGGATGCRTTGTKRVPRGSLVHHVRCVYTNKPWLNLDRMGDRDPEGIQFRVFLQDVQERSVLREGTFHVEMYKIGKDAAGQLSRTLVSDWHYPTSAVHRIAKPGLLGEGYVLRLCWGSKSLAGIEAEFVTIFEDQSGNKVRGSTKRFRIPKYRN